MRFWESYQVVNRLKQANYWIQVLLIISFIFGLNYLALHHFKRFDLTRDHRYALSPETKAYLQEVRDPIRFIITIPENSPRPEERVLFRYTRQLLQEDAYQSRPDGEALIALEYVDIYKDLARADTLAREYGLEQINSVLVLSNNRKRLLRADELVEFTNRKPVAFKGEAAITSAIMEVTRERSPKLYFLSGHQETSPEDPSPQFGLSEISRELQMRNYSLSRLDLSAVSEVPRDASALVLADPRGPLLPSEVEKIRSYLSDRAGRLLAWFRPGIDVAMEPLLAEWGISLPRQFVVEPDPAFRDSGNTLLIRNYSPHPVTHSLIQNQTFVLSGGPRPVFPRPPSPPDERLALVPLLATSNTSWADSNLSSSSNPNFNEDTDAPGPIPIALAAERSASSQLGIKVPGGRLIVFGSVDLFSNQRVSSLGNVSLFFNSLNWLLDREQLLSIPPRPLESYQLALSQAQLKRIAYLFLSVPASITLLAFIVYWVRRS